MHSDNSRYGHFEPFVYLTCSYSEEFLRAALIHGSHYKCLWGARISKSHFTSSGNSGKLYDVTQGVDCFPEERIVGFDARFQKAPRYSRYYLLASSSSSSESKRRPYHEPGAKLRKLRDPRHVI